MSNKKLFTLIFVAVLFLAVFLQFSTAFSEDFVFYSQRQDIAACSCGVTADTYTIRNTGAVTSTYQIIKSGSAASYSTLSEDYFSLEPGQAKEVTNYINLPCSAEGDYGLDLNVSTVFGLSKEFEQKVSAGSCVNFKILVKESAKEKCPCSPTTYEMEIENTGSFEDTYYINVTTYPQYASLSEGVVKLAPGAKKSVFVYFNLPCGIFGKQDLGLTVLAERSNQMADVPLTLDIGSCYDYSIESDSQFDLCEGSNITVPIKVKNTAGIGNTFTLESSKGFARILNSTFFLWGNESRSALMTVDALDLKAGDYDFQVNAFTERGNDRQSIDAKLTVEKCYDFSTKLSVPDEKIIAGKSYTYLLDVENKGTKAGKFFVSIDGPAWIKAIESNFTLESNGVKTVNLRADVPANASGDYVFSLTVDSEGLYDEKNVKMNVIDASTAYEIGIKERNKKVGLGEGEILVELENKGISGAAYSLSLTAPPWAQLSDKSVSLEPGEKKEIAVLTTIPETVEEGSYVITLLASLPQAGIGYSRDIQVKVIYAPWYAKAYNFIAPYAAAYWPYLLIAVAALIVLIFLIWMLKRIIRRAKERKKERPLESAIEEKREPEPVLREFATAAFKDAEHFRLSVKEPVKGKKFGWAKFFRIFFLLIFFGGIAALIWLNWPAIHDYSSKVFAVKNETGPSSYSPQVDINRSTGIEGYGNVVYIRETGDLDIPVIIKNRAPAKVIYKVRVANSSFIASDTEKLELDVNETKTMHLIVHSTPELSDGVYEIILGLNIDEKDLKYSEKIELRIEKQKSTFEKYLPYIIAGALLALALIVVLMLTRKSQFEKKRKKLDIKIARSKERNLKKPIGITVLIIAILVAGYGVYSYISSLPAPVEEQQGNLDISTFENQTMVLEVRPNQKIIIPLAFENRYSQRSSYSIEADADWIKSTEDSFRLDPGQSLEINITAEPTKVAQEGTYNIFIKGKVEDQEYSKQVSFNLKKYPTVGLLQNRYFVIGLVAIVLGAIILLASRKRKKDRKHFIEEIRQELKETKAVQPPVQTPAKPSKKSTKIRLGPKRKAR